MRAFMCVCVCVCKKEKVTFVIGNTLYFSKHCCMLCTYAQQALPVYVHALMCTYVEMCLRVCARAHVHVHTHQAKKPGPES